MQRAERNARRRSKRAQGKIELALLKVRLLSLFFLMGKRTTFTYAGEIRNDRNVRGMCKKLVKLSAVSGKPIVTKNLSAGDEALLDRALYVTRLHLATKGEVLRRSEELREHVAQNLTAGGRAFPAKFLLKDISSQDLKELRRIRGIVESSAIRWPVVQRSSPLYPRDIIEEMREKMLKKDENYRQHLASKELKNSMASKKEKMFEGGSSVPQPAAQAPDLGSSAMEAELGKGKTKAL